MSKVLLQHLLEVPLLALILLQVTRRIIILLSSALHREWVESSRPHRLHMHIVLLIVVGHKGGDWVRKRRNGSSLRGTQPSRGLIVVRVSRVWDVLEGEGMAHHVQPAILLIR